MCVDFNTVFAKFRPCPKPVKYRTAYLGVPPWILIGLYLGEQPCRGPGCRCGVPCQLSAIGVTSCGCGFPLLQIRFKFFFKACNLSVKLSTFTNKCV